MAFRFLSADKGPPPPPKDEQYYRPYSRSESVNVSSSSIMTAKNSSKLSLAALLTKIPNPLAASSRDPPNDDGISLPWNFQHHVHVDEGYVGLPPSWLTTAFSDEEIAQIQARRTAVLHGVGGGGFAHNHYPRRPPSPTSSLYPSVVQGHRRNQSSVDSYVPKHNLLHVIHIPDSTASSSTPNLVLPSLSESTSSPHPWSLSSTNLVPAPSPLPRRSPSPAPTQASLHPHQPPSTPSSATFSLAPRNILSDLSSAVKSSAGKGMRMFRGKRNMGSSPTSPPPSAMNRKNVHSRLSDETFFPPEIVSPDRATLSPTSPPMTASAPVWEMYSTSKSNGKPATTSVHHQPQPSTSNSTHSQLSKKSSLRRSNTSSSSTVRPNPTLSRTPSLKSIRNLPNLSRSLSKSQSSLSSARSLSLSSASHHSHHPLPSSSTPPRPAPVPSIKSTPGPSSPSSLPSTSSSLPSSTTSTQPPYPLPLRPSQLATSHSHSGSLASLVSIPEASPAPGAVVPVPMPAMPAGFGKSSLSRKVMTSSSKQHGGVNGSSSSSSSSRHQHHANPSISSTSSGQTHVSDVGSSYSQSPDWRPRSKSPRPPRHRPTPSTSSQQSSSSTTSLSNKSGTSILPSLAHSNASSHSISSSTSAHSDVPKTQELPMLSLSLPRMSLSLPFGEESFGAGVLGTGAGGAGTPRLGSTTTTGSSFGFGQGASNLSLGMSKWGDGKSGITNGSGNVASGSGTTKMKETDGKLTLPSIGVGASLSTSNLTLGWHSTQSLASTSTPNLTSTSTPNLLGFSIPTPRISMLPSNTSTSTSTPTMPIPIPKSKTPATTPSSTPTGTGISPARRRLLPSSKPLPSYPVPALPSTPSSSSLKDAAAPVITKLVPVPPTPFLPFQPSGLSLGARHHPNSPLPALPVASGSGSDMGLVNPNATVSNLVNPLPLVPRQQPVQAASPPPSVMMTPGNMLSPPLSTTARSAAQSPNSAQLWSEIAQMMDPGMMSAIPGLHLSTALPEDVRDVVRRAGEGDPHGAGEEDVPHLVGDLVGPSPTVSAAELGEGSIPRKLEDAKEDEDDEDDSGSEEYEEESYVVQSASVVAALPHHAHPVPQLQTQPLAIPIIPRVIEPLRTVGRPRLVNMNANGLVAAEQGRPKERVGDEEMRSELEWHKISEPSTQENRDTSRSSTATIVPRENGVNGQVTHSRLHRPPSMKLVISNGISHVTGNKYGMGAESSAMATMETTASGLTEGGGLGGSTTSYLAYYLEDGAPSPLPSPGSALGSPLRDVESGDEGSGSGRFGFGSQSTPNSSLSYGERRLDYDDDKYQLSYDGTGRGDESVLLGVLEGSEGGNEDDFYADYPEEEMAEAVKAGIKKQPRALPLTTPTITLNDGPHSLSDDDETKTTKVPLNGILTPVSSSSSPTDLTTDLTSPFLSASASPFQQRYLGWVSTLVAPLCEYIDEAVDPRDHYLDLTEIAEGESGSVYAARLNKSNAHKLKLGEVVRMQDLDDLGLRDADDNHGDHGSDKEGGKEDDTERGDSLNGEENENEEPMKLVAIKSIALVPSGTPKLVDLERELNLMRGLWHPQVLSVDAVYVDLVEDSVWLRMELMERSLADVIELVESGLVLQERTIARFASDVLLALEFISRHNIAHRDVRSDNMLINNQGILKLADFTNAVRVDPSRPLHTDVVGVPYWQAPELLLHNSSSPNTTNGRSVPPYDPLKLDVWSLGSTVWEMAETEPPFSNTNKFEDRWPPLSQPALYSPAFHEFLRKCSEPAASRPSAADLLQAPFINNACGRPVIVQLLAQCRTIEWGLRETN